MCKLAYVYAASAYAQTQLDCSVAQQQGGQGSSTNPSFQCYFTTTMLSHNDNAVSQQDQHDPDTSGKQISYYSALSLLRGKVYDALENHGRAVKWYQAALKADPFCYEAFQVTKMEHGLALGKMNFVI